MKLYWRKVGSIPEDDDYKLFFVSDNGNKDSFAEIREICDRHGNLMGYEVTWPLMETRNQFTSVHEMHGSLDDAMMIGRDMTIKFLKKYRGVSL